MRQTKGDYYPGEPCSSEGSTVGHRVLSLLPRLDVTNLDPNSSQVPSFKTKSRTTTPYNMPSTPTLVTFGNTP